MEFSTIVYTVLGFVFFVYLVSAVFGVPYLSVHNKQAKKMIDLSGLRAGQKAVDLGSGVGNLLFLAAERGGIAIGYELNPFLVLINKYLIWKNKAGDKVSVKLKSLYQADLKDVDVVFAFLLPGPMEKLEKKLFSELKNGALILSYAFPIPNQTPIKKEQGIFVYQVGK